MVRETGDGWIEWMKHRDKPLKHKSLIALQIVHPRADVSTHVTKWSDWHGLVLKCRNVLCKCDNCCKQTCLGWYVGTNPCYTCKFVFATLITALCKVAYIWKCCELCFHTSVNTRAPDVQTVITFIHAWRLSLSWSLNSLGSWFHLL